MPAEAMPETIGPYHVVGLLGKGGMGSVYKAYKPPLKRYVAVKTIKSEFLSSPGALERFRREAELSSQLKHPNIVTVYDYEEVPGADSYIVTEIIEGGITLRDRLHQGSLNLAEISSIINQIASALDYAYEAHNIVHRDIKPGNVFFEGGKRVALGDFGIAKDVSRSTQLTSLGEGVGTPDYMSPEQAMGEPLDRRSDIYALGVVLFEMLTGSLPFRGDTPISVVMGHIQKPVPPIRSMNPDIPPSVETIVNKSLSKKKEDRFSSAGEMARALEMAIKGGAVDPATIALAPSNYGSPQNSTFGMAAAPSPNPFATQELNVIAELERQNQYQEAFNRLHTLQSRFPTDTNITTRYRFYVTQGYVPSTRMPGNITSPTGSGTLAVPKRGSNTGLILAIVGVVIVAVIAVVLIVVVGGGKPTPTATVAIITTVATTTVPPTVTNAPPTPTTSAIDLAAQLNKDGEGLLDSGNVQGSIDKFKEAVRLAPNVAIYHDNLSTAYNLTKEYTLAENEARLAVSIDSSIARFHNNLGLALFNQGKKADAQKSYQEATRLKPSEPLYHRNLAECLVDLGKPDVAEQEVRRAITLYATDTSKDKDKNLAAANNILGDSLLDQAKYPDAEKAYRDAVKLMPSSAIYQLNVSNALYYENKYPEAEAEARKAISLDPNYAAGYNLLGLTLELQEKWGDSNLAYAKAVQISPKVALYHRNVAGTLIELKRYPEAEQEAQAAIQIDPNSASNARAYNLLGIALYQQKKNNPAIDAYQKAIQLNGKVSVYYSNLGLCFEATSQPLKAREAYQKALDIDPANEDAKVGLSRVK
ncbi:tetratricopeptide repeat protein [Candidatus Chlorohelix sp.]|uniref:protein kinase domain-containing protein n=1 Tax=Candidatus Chlorohelix sp. TaxID=3139201 RepID=UPI00304298CB